MQLTKYLLVIIGSYLIGSLSTSIFFSQRKLGEDVRKLGSGNAGATNMARVYGFAAGALTLFGDAAKSAVSMLIGWLLLGEAGIAAGGIACIVGHCFPVYYNFRGGKGVSVGAAIALAVDWRAFIIVVLAFAAGAFSSKKVSLGSICSALCLPVAALLLNVGAERCVLGICAALLVLFQHRANISRLIKGTEPDFKAAKRKTEIKKN